MEKLNIRRYEEGEEESIWNIFYNTIHSINLQHYSDEQVEAWAPSNLQRDVWKKKITDISPYVVLLNSKVVAYADLQNNGYIDHFFCHHEFQRQGIGSVLYTFLEQKAVSKNIIILESDVSITARPFFEFNGFIVAKEQAINVRGQNLKNYKMKKHLEEKKIARRINF